MRHRRLNIASQKVSVDPNAAQETETADGAGEEGEGE